jgi:uncharacterized damage-inducible protein DinB
MIGVGYLREMSGYGAWQNETVYRLCDGLDDAERRRDRGMFFGSIHRTLAHVAYVDRWILDLLDGLPPPPFDPSRPASEGWVDLKAERTLLDGRIADLAASATAPWLEKEIAVESARLGRMRRIPRALYLMQMFNHGTHHRSQVTAELWRMGIDYGCTDIPFRPGSPF